MVLLALLALSCLGAQAATGATHGLTPDPSPQKAPSAASSSAPAPDPAPQAVSRSQPAHSTTPPATWEGSSSVAAPITPHVVPVTAPARSITGSHVVAVSSTPARTVARVPHRRARVSHPAPRHAPPARHTAAHPISLSFLLGSLPADLFRLPALHAGGSSHRDGVLLLLSSVAMALLAVASFSLFRRLRRLDGQTR